MDRNLAPRSRLTFSFIGTLHECKSVHEQKHFSFQAFLHESSKVGGRGKERGKERGRGTGQTEARRLMKRKAAQQNKNLSEELKQNLPRSQHTQLDEIYEDICNRYVTSWLFIIITIFNLLLLSNSLATTRNSIEEIISRFTQQVFNSNSGMKNVTQYWNEKKSWSSYYDCRTGKLKIKFMK